MSLRPYSFGSLGAPKQNWPPIFTSPQGLPPSTQECAKYIHSKKLLASLFVLFCFVLFWKRKLKHTNATRDPFWLYRNTQRLVDFPVVDIPSLLQYRCNSMNPCVDMCKCMAIISNIRLVSGDSVVTKEGRKWIAKKTKPYEWVHIETGWFNCHISQANTPSSIKFCHLLPVHMDNASKSKQK